MAQSMSLNTHKPKLDPLKHWPPSFLAPGTGFSTNVVGVGGQEAELEGSGGGAVASITGSRSPLSSSSRQCEGGPGEGRMLSSRLGA